ncbi:MAG: DUF3368 domain-containing protein [Planctomycetia bacterium]|nr:DUF3368 domain-containing protein [Planctomycetia bacterium]
MKVVINTTPLVSLAAIDKLCLLDAKKIGKISQLKPFLDRLIGGGVYISENLYDKALSLASEK